MVTKYYCNGNVSTFLLLALIYGHVTDTQTPTIVLGITLPSGGHPTLDGTSIYTLHQSIWSLITSRGDGSGRSYNT